MQRLLTLNGGPKTIPQVHTFVPDYILSSGRKMIRKCAARQKLIGKVVGKKGTPEKGCAREGAIEKKQAGEVFYKINKQSTKLFIIMMDVEIFSQVNYSLFITFRKVFLL